MKLTEYTDKNGNKGYKTEAGNLITPESIARLTEISDNLDKSRRVAEENLRYLKALVEKYQK